MRVACSVTLSIAALCSVQIFTVSVFWTLLRYVRSSIALPFHKHCCSLFCSAFYNTLIDEHYYSLFCLVFCNYWIFEHWWSMFCSFLCNKSHEHLCLLLCSVLTNMFLCFLTALYFILMFVRFWCWFKVRNWSLTTPISAWWLVAVSSLWKSCVNIIERHL